MFDRFAKEKNDFLSKKDKSRKGSIDKGILKLVDKINASKEFYTTSSCSGRILVIEKKSDSKKDAEWLFISHEKVKSSKIIKTLKKKIEFPIFFKQESFILHVACRNIECAKSFLDNARTLFKKAGIISVNDKKVMVEVVGTEKIETIVTDKSFVADEKFIEKLVEYSNINMDKNKKNIGKFLKIIK